MKLNMLKDNAGARKSRMRVGRGIGSGKGKTAGRGHKGMKSRSGVAIKGFEGGQMPIHMRMPKRGFNSRSKTSYEIVNLGMVQKAIDNKKIDVKKAVNEDALRAAGLVNKTRSGIRLLAKGELKTKVNFEIHTASKSALEAVEKAGGKVTILKSGEEKAEPKEKAKKESK